MRFSLTSITLVLLFALFCPLALSPALAETKPRIRWRIEVRTAQRQLNSAQRLTWEQEFTKSDRR